MRLRFCGQVPKDLKYPEANEDSLSVLESEGRLALSDGASESFDSKIWAKLLVDEYVQNPALHPDWLNGLVLKYASVFDVNSMSWSKQAAYERGSFATLIGIEHHPHSGSIEVLSVGDSLAVLLANDEFVDSFPYAKSDDFKKRPELFSTNPSHNTFFPAKNFYLDHLKPWQVNGNETLVLCMTDALGEWALRCAEEGRPQWSRLSTISSGHELEDLVSSERACKRMRIDDVSLLVVSFEKENISELPNS